MKFSKKALVFGLDSFTGSYMKSSLEKQNINVVGTSFDKKSSNYCNITDSNQCECRYSIIAIHVFMGVEKHRENTRHGQKQQQINPPVNPIKNR